MALKKRSLRSVIRFHRKKLENAQVRWSSHQYSEAVNSKISLELCTPSLCTSAGWTVTATSVRPPPLSGGEGTRRETRELQSQPALPSGCQETRLATGSLTQWSVHDTWKVCYYWKCTEWLLIKVTPLWVTSLKFTT